MLLNRKVLARLFTSLCLLGLLFALLPFGRSLSPGAAARSEAQALITLPLLRPGQLAQIEVAGRPLFLFRPTAAQRSALDRLDSEVWQSESRAWQQSIGAYVYWGLSTGNACRLEEVPAQAAAVPSGGEWLGGYWDARCEISYDYAGRAIRNPRYSWNGYSRDVANLAVPAVFEAVGERYLVSAAPL